ncbi:MAG TPA: response regulator transcription factor [Chloroflexi bacterium]|nr:response regulator transcription factor [Chloroflexota bacterium]
MKEKSILLVSDELNLLRTLRRNLISRGYEVSVALDDKEASHFISSLDTSLFIICLDFETVELNGLEIIREIREKSEAPIIVISAVGSENLKIEALDFGADDYLVIPFGMEEFLARVRSALRRWSSQMADHQIEENIMIFGKLHIYTNIHQVNVDGKKIHFTPLEYDLLYFLAQNRGRVVTHRELLRKIWGPEYGDEREYLRVFISQIRKKIEIDPASPVHIVTEPRIGYRFGSDDYLK